MIELKKIVYLVTEDWYFCSHRRQLAEAVQQAGFTVSVITRAGVFADRVRRRGFDLYPLDLHRSLGSPLRESGTIYRLVGLYRQIKPDLVHHVGLKAIIVGSLAAWIARVPRVVNAYTGLGHVFMADSLLPRFARYAVMPLTSVFLRGKRINSIVQNPDDEKLLLKHRLIHADRTSLIRGSGVDIDKFRYIAEPVTEQPVVLFASRLLRDKGIMEFAAACRVLQSRGVRARFVIVGKPDKDNPTSIDETEVCEWVDEGLVEWWGYRDDMSEAFEQANLVCLPSYREGLPKVLLEAAACGRAIVTTDVPGCREVVINGLNGFLVPARDHNRLADAIERLLGDPDMRRSMGKAGRQRVVENFTLEAVNTATIKLYNRLLCADTRL